MLSGLQKQSSIKPTTAIDNSVLIFELGGSFIAASFGIKETFNKDLNKLKIYYVIY